MDVSKLTSNLIIKKNATFSDSISRISFSKYLFYKIFSFVLKGNAMYQKINKYCSQLLSIEKMKSKYHKIDRVEQLVFSENQKLLLRNLEHEKGQKLSLEKNVLVDLKTIVENEIWNFLYNDSDISLNFINSFI